jgi:DNA-binding transcriptional MerR regulator
MPRATFRLLKIGELARLTHVSARTIRFYVEEGLLPKPVKTHRNMAYYDPACVPRIAAIKKAQQERFLPLEVIGRILRENGQDFAALDSDPRRPAPGRAIGQAEPLDPALLDALSRRRWVSSRRSGNLTAGDRDVAELFAACQRLECGRPALFAAFEAIEKQVRTLVTGQCRGWLARADELPHQQAGPFFDKLSRGLQQFVRQAHENALREALKRHNRTLDNAVLAVGDEGYGIPLREIEVDLRALEERARGRDAPISSLIDLATGYSCAGDQKRAMGFLRRAVRRDPGNIPARVRWCWYNRFSSGGRSSRTWRDRLGEICEQSPGDIPAHVFLGTWYAFDATQAPDNMAALRLIGLCLRELKTAEAIPAPDLHEWTLVRYARGLVATFILASLGDHAAGIRAFEEILARRGELDGYYRQRMPFFPKWLWPNLLYFLGAARIQTGGFAQAAEAFRLAGSFRVSALFRRRLDTGLRQAEEGLKAAAPSLAEGGTP